MSTSDRCTSAAQDARQPVVPEDDGPILEVEDLNVSFFVDGEWFPAAIDVSYHVDAGEVLAIVGESGSGKTQSSMSLLGLLPANGRATGSAQLKGKELVGLHGRGAARGPRQGDRGDLPGADDGAEPGLHDRLPDRGDDPLPLRHVAQGGQGAGHRAAHAGGDPGAGAPLRRLPAPALRRSAPARDDRPGARLRAAAPRRRRADHRARRHRAGRDPQADARPARAGQRRRRADHPRHGRRRRHGRPHRGDAARPHRRDRHRRPDLQPRRSTPTPSSCSPRCRTSARSARPRRRGAHGARPGGAGGRDARADHGRREPRPGVPQARQPAGLPRRRRRLPDDRPGRGRRPGRRVRLGQDHHRPRGAGPAPGGRRQARGRRREDEGRHAPRTSGRCATGSASSSRTRAPR